MGELRQRAIEDARNANEKLQHLCYSLVAARKRREGVVGGIIETLASVK